MCVRQRVWVWAWVYAFFVWVWVAGNASSLAPGELLFHASHQL